MDLYAAAYTGCCLCSWGLFLTGPFLRGFTDDPQIYKMSCEYTRIVLCFSIGSMYHLYSEKLFQATGSMILPMIFQGVGAIFNIILDPILIFGWFGLPAMGVQGGGDCHRGLSDSGRDFVHDFFVKKCRAIPICLKGFRPDKTMLWKIYTVGIPSAIMHVPAVPVGCGVKFRAGGFFRHGDCSCSACILKSRPLCTCRLMGHTGYASHYEL